MNINEIEKLDWNKMSGIIPAVVQDASTLQVLMLGYMTRQSLSKTFETGNVCFFSRSRQQVWTKGEGSGNLLKFSSVEFDCDCDALLIKAEPLGPTCHYGTVSCFGSEEAEGVGFLAKLERIICDREQKRPEDSYTSELFAEGLDRIAQKVGEEAVETVIAAKNSSNDLFKNECADLLFHILVLLRQKNVPIVDVIDTLKARHN